MNYTYQCFSQYFLTSFSKAPYSRLFIIKLIKEAKSVRLCISLESKDDEGKGNEGMFCHAMPPCRVQSPIVEFNSSTSCVVTSHITHPCPIYVAMLNASSVDCTAIYASILGYVVR